jgi:3-hydroxyisobutyrate dehydrogenase-like beta-hydroxyacid dehydrogenase
MTQTVGFIGLGRMGSRIARNIAKSGFPMVVHNRTRERADAFAAEVGADVAGTPAEAAAASDVVVTMLSDDAAVGAVYGGGDGALSAMGPGKTAMDMSTVSPGFSRELGDRLRAAGAAMVDAPVSGSVATAESAGLLIMAGGTEEDIERVRPILETTSSSIVRLGDQGSGALMKVCVNAILFGLIQGLAENLVVAERSGIDREAALEVIVRSAIGAPAIQYRRREFEHPGEDPPMFTIDLAMKDLRLALDLAASVSAGLPQTERTLGVMGEAAAAGFGQQDIAALAEYLRRRSH